MPRPTVAQTLSQGSPRSPCASRSTPSRIATRRQGSDGSGAGATAGAVARMKRSNAATTAAASSGEAEGAINFSLGVRAGIDCILTHVRACLPAGPEAPWLRETVR